MKKAPSLLIAVAMVIGADAYAAPTAPVLVVERDSAHVQAPRWAPDGSQLAVDVFNPKKDTRGTWIVSFGAGGQKLGETEVKTGRSRASALLGGKQAPIVELAWAPDMKLLSKPYVFSSRGPKKNFDLFADGAWLTSNPGNDGQPAWSRDGRFIAYTSQRRDSGDIYVIDLQGDMDKPSQVTLWPNATEFAPRWSPLKNYLLFVRSQDGNKGQDIGLVADVLRPQDSTQMVTDWRGDEIRPSWSPSGTEVAFYSNKDQKNPKLFDLWVSTVDGKTARKLASDVVVDELGPAWSPDGQVVFYVKRDFKTNNPIHWVERTGGASKKINTKTQLNSDLSIFAEPTGRIRLAFRSVGQDGAADKTWQRIYVTTFTMTDLRSGALQ